MERAASRRSRAWRTCCRQAAAPGSSASTMDAARGSAPAAAWLGTAPGANLREGSSAGLRSDGIQRQWIARFLAIMMAPMRRHTCRRGYDVALPFSRAKASPKLSTKWTNWVPWEQARFARRRRAQRAARPSRIVIGSGIENLPPYTTLHSSFMMLSGISGKPRRSRHQPSSGENGVTSRTVSGAEKGSSATKARRRGCHSSGGNLSKRQRSCHCARGAASSGPRTRSHAP